MVHDVKDILRGIFWILNSGSQWRKLPKKEFPPSSTVHRWHQRFSHEGICDILHEHMLQDAADENLLSLSCTFIDGSFVRAKGAHEKVGNSKACKGSKLLAIVDENTFPIAIHMDSANPHESKSIMQTINAIPESIGKIRNLVGDKAYDSDPLDKQLKEEKGIDLIAPHKSNRTAGVTQDPDVLKENYSKRHKVENFWAQLQWGRRIVVRYEKKSTNFLGFSLFRASLCIMQLMGYFVNT